MDRQLIVQKQGEHYHLDFHNFMGSFEGHAIGKWLKLEEIEYPGEARFSALKPGQFYLENLMGRHPDLHAVVGADRLEDVVRAADHFHVRVIEGAEYLPELPPEERERHQDVNYLEYLDKQHESVIHKGPKAMIGAFLLRAVPAALVIFGIVVASRHMTSAREEVGLPELFRRAGRPPAEQNAWQAFVKPDHSHELVTSISAIRFMEGELVLMEDGTMLRFAGMGDVRPMLEMARMNNTLPKIHVTLRDGGVYVREIVVREHIFGQGSRLEMAAKLPASLDQGVAGRMLADMNELEEVPLGERCKARGRLARADDGIEFEPVGPGPKLTLRPARSGGHYDTFVQMFADGKTEIEIVFSVEEEVEEPVRPARLYAVTAQNYHLSLEG